MIRTAVIDDEPLARRRICDLLSAEDDFQVVGNAADGEAAVRLIRRTSPDLVFLDIQMPRSGGFDVIEALGAENMPLTVFVTAFDTFAVQAFEAQALDYILKPFDDARMKKALARVRRQLKLETTQGDRIANLLRQVRPVQDGSIVVNARGKRTVLHYNDITWISAAGGYSEVHCGGRSWLLDEALASLSSRLPADQFGRIHRSTIVRLGCISQIIPAAHGDAHIRLQDGTGLRLSRRYRDALACYLSAP
ncbi:MULTISPECIES: LytTR family DNA-binding domain-containing protein [Asticcacaulis]|uniref:LytR/AlgR family response regulator transcription factor n=1 Tax=Asticcacaulis TaxID=76890 RepID=UPI001AE58EED|nr:response regulator [Asticcacaulis sp. BE141]MBP2160294.1 two-component system LytT family response regulator [Asticcacaulis solisilvae]MDR6801403.1 two-component system LytT family response regulator [Asticcacaulis sp. BE141]